jgi:hypothetical protein
VGRQGDGWQAAAAAWQPLAMTVVLPDDGRLADVEALVARGDLTEVLAAPTPAEIRLRCRAGPSAATPPARCPTRHARCLATPPTSR